MTRLRHALANGEWKLTHQPIAFDTDAQLLDGVHRLTAITEQRKHVAAIVAFDCDPDTFKVIDTGGSRTPGDTLKIAGHENVNILAAAARLVGGYPKIVGTSETFRLKTLLMTSMEVLDVVEDPETGKILEDSLAVGMRAANGIGRYGLRTTLTALIAIIRLYTTYGPSTREEFNARLADGVHLDPTSPILGFRRWATSESGYAKLPRYYASTVAMAKGIQAWNAYAGGEERVTKMFRPGVDLMPEID